MFHVAEFAWNNSTVPLMAYLTPAQMIFSARPRQPHDLIFFKEKGQELAPVDEAAYQNYANVLHDQLQTNLQLYQDAKMLAVMKSNKMHDRQGKIKNASELEWLLPGKLVIVYRPTSISKGGKWSAKLLFQFKGPYRIEKVHRTAVHLKSLSGQPESTQNLRNVYPYHCHVDDMIDNFDRTLLTRVEQNTTSLDLEGHMVIVDLSDSHGLDFRVARLVNKIDDDKFVIHYYDSPSKADLSKRPFYPAYSYTSGKRTMETYTLTPPEGALPMESTFKLDEILLKPFHLTKKHHIPSDICEKLLLNGFCMLISWFDQDPGEDRASSSLKRKNPPP